MNTYKGIQKTLNAFNFGGVRGYHFPNVKVSEFKEITPEEITLKCAETFHTLNQGKNKGDRFFSDYSLMSGLLSQWRANLPFNLGGPKTTLDFCLELDKPQVFCVPEINKYGTMYPVFILSNGTEIDLNEVYEFWRQDCEECRFTVKILAPWIEKQEYTIEPDKDFYGKYVIEGESIFPTTYFAKILFS